MSLTKAGIIQIVTQETGIGPSPLFRWTRHLFNS
jgi:hypothetical protein